MNQRRAEIVGGFTLIELLLAIGLSLGVTFVTFTGFRIASQSVTICNRLSLENSLMRTGFLMAVDEVDHWSLYDDPDNPASQKLRGYDLATHRGLPFTPFKGHIPATTFTGGETDRGWDGAYAWPANDSRTWFHANQAECGPSTPRWFGQYELFTGLKSSITLTGAFTNGVAFGAVSPKHTWLPNQLLALRNTMGYYGMAEYLPANAIYAVLGSAGADGVIGSSDDRDFGYENEWVEPSSAVWRGCKPGGGTQFPRGLYRLTKDTNYAVVPGNQWTPATTGFSTRQLIDDHDRFYSTGAWADPGTVRDFLDRTMMVKPLLNARPTHWPDVSVAVSRYVCYLRFTNVCKVRWQSPLTAQMVEISFSTLGTSLRGARQQRGLDGN